MPSRRRDEDGDVKVRKKSDLKKPRMYKVLVHNDDYTTMEFVVWVLTRVFHLSNAAATRIMLHIHRSGIGVAGTYTRDVAETRVDDDLDGLRTRINERSVEAIGVPCREVVLVRPSTLPKTSSGKLQRALCRRQYTEGGLAAVS